MASSVKQKSLLKPGLAMALTMSGMRGGKSVDNDSIVDTPPGSPPSADTAQQTSSAPVFYTQSPEQKLQEANILTPDASPIHEMDTSSPVKAPCVYHPSTPVTPRVVQNFVAPKPCTSESRNVRTNSSSIWSTASHSEETVPATENSLVQQAIFDICRFLSKSGESARPAPAPVARGNKTFSSLLHMDPFSLDLMPPSYYAWLKEQKVAELCPSCNRAPTPLFLDDCSHSCHRAYTPSNVTLSDFRNALDPCSHPIPVLMRVRELEDARRAARLTKYAAEDEAKFFTMGSLHSDGESSSVESSDGGQSPALEVRMARRVKKVKRRIRPEVAEVQPKVEVDSDNDVSAVPACTSPRIIVATSSCKGSGDQRVPDVRIHAYIPSDHNSYCAPAKSSQHPQQQQQAAPPPGQVEQSSAGIVVVKEANGRLNTTVPGSLPADSATPRKFISQVGRKRTSGVGPGGASPTNNNNNSAKRSRKNCMPMRGEAEGDMSTQALMDKKEKHKQSERVRRQRSGMLITDLTDYIKDSCPEEVFNGKSRTASMSKHNTVHIAIKRFLQLDQDNNRLLLTLNSITSSAYELLKNIQPHIPSEDKQVYSQRMKDLKTDFYEMLQHAQDYAK